MLTVYCENLFLNPLFNKTIYRLVWLIHVVTNQISVSYGNLDSEILNKSTIGQLENATNEWMYWEF